MRIVNIIGGLGNQMFQYALAVSLANEFKNEEILIDTNCFNGYGLHDGYLLDAIFDIKIRKAKKSEILKLNYPFFHYRLWQIGRRILPGLKHLYREKRNMVYDPAVFLHDGSMYYDGYWQSALYFNGFEEEIRRAFTFPALDDKNRAFIDSFKGKTIVSVHIRRGDYLEEKLFRGLTGLDYYRRAIGYILDVTDVECFMIMSNDMVWCRNHIPEITRGVHCEFVDWNKGENSFRDMQLMSLCQHNIIANSSFSWWGAWLNPNPGKMVLSPHRWINMEERTDIIPDSWIKI